MHSSYSHSLYALLLSLIIRDMFALIKFDYSSLTYKAVPSRTDYDFVFQQFRINFCLIFLAIYDQI